MMMKLERGFRINLDVVVVLSQKASEIGSHCHLECSAALKKGVDEVFETALRLALRLQDPNDNEDKDKGCIVC